MACPGVLLRRLRRIQNIVSAAAKTTPRTVPRTILATLAPFEDELLPPADAVIVAIGGSATVLTAAGVEVVEVESVAGVYDAKGVDVDDPGGDVVEDDSAF